MNLDLDSVLEDFTCDACQTIRPAWEGVCENTHTEAGVDQAMRMKRFTIPGEVVEDEGVLQRRDIRKALRGW